MPPEADYSLLTHLPPGAAEEFMARAEAEPGAVSPAQMLQKLIIFDFVQPLAEALPHDRIAEIGCGQGVHSALLSRLGRVEALELVETELWMGRDVDQVRQSVFSRLGQGEITFHPLEPDGGLPLADGSLDLVFHNSVIEHVPDPVAFNQETARTLKPGGAVICITGTPRLCWWRLVRYHLPRLPALAAMFLASELGATSLAGRDITRPDRRLARLTDPAPAPSAQPIPRPGRFYARLRHYLKSPAYNRLVLDGLAQETGLPPAEALGGLQARLRRPCARLAMALTPETHGQHYQSAWDELRAWRVDTWRQSFEAAGLRVERVIGYRYHHLYEALGRGGRAERRYLKAVPRIHDRIAQPGHRPERATEIIIVARRPRD